MCEYVHRVAETDWYALVCHNIWHHKYIPVLSEGGGKLRYSDFHTVDCTFFFPSTCICVSASRKLQMEVASKRWTSRSLWTAILWIMLAVSIGAVHESLFLGHCNILNSSETSDYCDILNQTIPEKFPLYSCIHRFFAYLKLNGRKFWIHRMKPWPEITPYYVKILRDVMFDLCFLKTDYFLSFPIGYL